MHKNKLPEKEEFDRFLHLLYLFLKLTENDKKNNNFHEDDVTHEMVENCLEYDALSQYKYPKKFILEINKFTIIEIASDVSWLYYYQIQFLERYVNSIIYNKSKEINNYIDILKFLIYSWFKNKNICRNDVKNEDEKNINNIYYLINFSDKYSNISIYNDINAVKFESIENIKEKITKNINYYLKNIFDLLISEIDKIYNIENNLSENCKYFRDKCNKTITNFKLPNIERQLVSNITNMQKKINTSITILKLTKLPYHVIKFNILSFIFTKEEFKHIDTILTNSICSADKIQKKITKIVNNVSVKKRNYNNFSENNVCMQNSNKKIKFTNKDYHIKKRASKISCKKKIKLSELIESFEKINEKRNKKRNKKNDFNNKILKLAKQKSLILNFNRINTIY